MLDVPILLCACLYYLPKFTECTGQRVNLNANYERLIRTITGHSVTWLFTPALWRLKKDNHKFKSNLDNLVITCLTIKNKRAGDVALWKSNPRFNPQHCNKIKINLNISLSILTNGSHTYIYIHMNE